jgi:ribonuclease M5
MTKIKVKIPVIVEGRYDKAKLSNIIDGVILTTDGFGIFKNNEKRALMKTLGKNGVIVLCDSDGGGTIIRSAMRSLLGGIKTYNIYIPQIKGTERRKSAPSAAGYLGVEGMDDAVLRKIFESLSRTNPELFDETAEDGETASAVSKIDLYELGLTGGHDSSAMRDQAAAKLGLPAGMSANAFQAALSLMGVSREALTEATQK